MQTTDRLQPETEAKPDNGQQRKPGTIPNLDRLRLSQDFAATLGVKKALLTVPVRKPDRNWFIRVHPDEEYRIQTAVLEFKEEREIYLVDPDICPQLAGDIIPKALFTTVNRQGVVFIWAVRLPGEDGRVDHWNESALEAVTMAQRGWVRVAANMSLGAYDVFEATGNLPEPTWPEQTFQELCNIAFKGRYIDTLNHPAVRRLRGEI